MASINFLIIPSSVINSNKNIGAAKPPDKSLYASLMFLFIIEAHLMQFNMCIYIYIYIGSTKLWIKSCFLKKVERELLFQAPLYSLQIIILPNEP